MQSLIYLGENICCKYIDKPYLTYITDMYEEFEHNEHWKTWDESLSFPQIRYSEVQINLETSVSLVLVQH